MLHSPNSKAVAGTLTELERRFTVFLKNAGLSETAIEAVFTTCQQQHYNENQNLVRQGETCKSMYFVGQGLLRYYLITPAGHEVNKSIRIAPCVVGSTVSLVKQIPSALNICGFGELDCLQIDWFKFNRLMSKNHELERFYRRGVEANFIEHEQRELSLLMESAEQRYLDFLDQYADVVERIPLYQVASFIGITAIALSRIRKRLGMVAKPNKKA